MTPNPPGLFEMPPTQPGGDEEHAIEKAVRDAFDDLESKGVLGPIEKAKRAALIKAGAGLDRGFSSPKVSVATSTVLKQVMEGLDTLPRPAEGTDIELDAFDRSLAALTDQALGMEATA
ncbi:hypothetical protein [Actinomyces urogenitalis]|uniref:hypothetical protein n=1 Tax=Actinomyces urogenitalis TaxID=103621 RepID=UPI002431F061|nr:hypothetical protein [Actinomyces urogenitalis]MBS5978046.1 hypothetical protein [Actinomyces urogenitalis]MDU0865327.1 hypothetical protein [Actinomyces urogenitalis]MDU0875782.1 hypothetical protein [Actinomyces urogenitalis]MDU1565493.1 hypothetical protein [Actinomyces urogenitalis]MDU1640867.1 hypothetical protein [Actinomyces urogenitalis]